MSDILVWVDIETTGLDPDECDILELGLVVTDKALQIVDQKSWLIKPVSLDLLKLNKFVVDTHTRNGLFAEVAELGQLRSVAVHEACLWLAQGDGDKSPMCGSSVHFDRTFLQKHCPSLCNQFHYRNIDISTIKELAKRFNPSLLENMPAPQAEHRALPDLYDTLAEARHYMEGMGWL